MNELAWIGGNWDNQIQWKWDQQNDLNRSAINQSNQSTIDSDGEWDGFPIH
jgi:hypothetical protein